MARSASPKPSRSPAGRISAVGSSSAILAAAGPATRRIDLKGATVIPGLMDNHLHSAGGGPGVDLSRARSTRRGAAGRRCACRDDAARRHCDLQQRLARSAARRAAPAASRRSRYGRAEARRSSSCAADTNTSSIRRRWHGGRSTRRRPNRTAAASRATQNGRLNGELVDRAKALVRLPRPPRDDARRAPRRRASPSISSCTPRVSRRSAIRASRSTNTGCCRRCSAAGC